MLKNPYFCLSLTRRLLSLSLVLILGTSITLQQQVYGFPIVSLTQHNATGAQKRLQHLFFAQDLEKVESKSRVWNTVTGGLTFGGGLIGFVTKGSKASLIAGSTFGGLLLLSNQVKSVKLGSIVSFCLMYVMGKKFMVSKKFMPAGLIASLGIVSFVYNLWAVILKSTKGGSNDESSTKEET